MGEIFPAQKIREFENWWFRVQIIPCTSNSFILNDETNISALIEIKTAVFVFENYRSNWSQNKVVSIIVTLKLVLKHGDRGTVVKGLEATSVTLCYIN